MIGKTLSHYRIVERLGGGGMGVVYKAEDTRLKRFVALKFLPAESVADPEARARFQLEARTASSLDHPNLCTVFDIGDLEDGSTYIAMALYEGETLQQRLAREPLPLPEALEIALQIADGLEQAHARQVIHRDIKPANCILTPEGVVKIVDFGLAKFSETQAGGPDETVGTFYYMSPEQTRGDEVDHRTDIWSLGATLYEMLSGSRPFKGRDGRSVAYAILNLEPKPLSVRVPRIPGEIEEIVHRCLAKDPDERFADTGELRRALARFRDSHSAPTARLGRTAGTDSPDSLPTRRPPARGREWVASLAVLPFRNLSPGEEQEYFCDGVTEQLITNLAAIQSLKVIGRTSVMAYKGTTKDARQIGRELGVAHILEGSIRKAVAGNRVRVNADLLSTDTGFAIWSKTYDHELKDIFTVQDDLARSITESLEIAVTPQVAAAIRAPRVRNFDAYEAAMKAMYFANRFFFSLSEVDYKNAVRFGQEAVGHDPAYSFGYVALSYVHGMAFFMTRNPALVEACRAAALKAYELNSQDSAAVMAVAGLYDLEGDHDAAFRYFSRSISLNPNNGLAVHLMGRTVGYGFGLHEEAIRYYDRAIELDPLFSFPHHNRAYSHLCRGRLEEARADLERALELQPNDHLALGHYCELLTLGGELDTAAEIAARREALLPDAGTYHRALLLAARGEARALELDPNPRVAALLGRQEEALEALAAAIERTGHPGWEELTGHPAWESLRGLESFAELVASQHRRHEELVARYAAGSTA